MPPVSKRRAEGNSNARRPRHTPWNVNVAALAWRCPIATLAVHFDGML
jgi:hypothetical protein